MFGRLATRCDAHVSRHAEVNQERATALEPNNQILAAPIDCDHALPFESTGDGRRIERPRQAWVADLHALQSAPAEKRLELRADALDFW